MLKDILNLKGAKSLGKEAQQQIHGGGNNCFSFSSGPGCRCDAPTYCVIVSPSGQCPNGTVAQDPACFYDD